MTDCILFERPYKGSLWRLEISTYRGRTIAQWRRWYLAEEGWTRTGDGCAFPLESLATLAGALAAHMGQEPPQGAVNGS